MPRAKREQEGVGASHPRRVLAQHAEAAIAVLVTLMQDSEQKPELRMKAAESILDRVLGKAGGKEQEGERVPLEVRFEGALEEWSG